MSSNLQIKNHIKETNLYINRTMVAICLCSIIFIMLITRLIVLQIYQHDKFLTLATNNQVRMMPIEPPRGLIYDRNGILLAENIPIYSLEMIPSKIKNVNATIKKLSNIIRISDHEIAAFRKQMLYKTHFESIPLRSRLSEEEVARFALNKHLFPEVDTVVRLSRNYTMGTHLSHVIGYTGMISENELKNIDNNKYRGIYQIGKVGIEKSAETLLRGKPGYKKIETDAKGHTIRELDSSPPTPGQDLYLTIDAKLQQFAYKTLGSKLGAIVAVDPQNGDILALVSNPSYDPNLFAQGIDHGSYQKLQLSPEQPLFNRAISGQYPPGSLVKPIIALQALENNIISPHTKVHDQGFYKLKDDKHIFRGWKEKGHGLVDLEDAIAESCATYFYHVAHKLGIQKLHDVFTQFGLGKPVGLNIEGESLGLAPSAKWKQQTKHIPWFPGDTLITGMGQGYTLVTPVQVAQLVSIIANRGAKHSLTTIKNTQAPNPDLPPEKIIKLNNEHNWDTIISAMEKTISSYKGTAHVIYNPNKSIAGKTGTAQVFSIKQDAKYEEDKISKQLRDHSWFMAFSPIKSPKIAIAVIIEHEKGSSRVANKLINFYLEKQQHG